MPSSLDLLEATGTIVVCDSGDFQVLDEYKPTDATTNPSLILAASKKPEYAHLVDKAVEYGKDHGSTTEEKVDAALDYLLVLFGSEILKRLPEKGRVSTEVDARFSHDTQKSVDKALHIIELYKSIGIDKSRVLIKIASTWEGIKAAEKLQAEHKIDCNLTLLFSLTQAVAAAEAGAFLISPFVGRILDWYKANEKKEYTAAEDPGVKSVREIYYYYKKHGHGTVVMGASFRNSGEITELAGCDRLTISPSLLAELKKSTEPVPSKLKAADAAALDIPAKTYIQSPDNFAKDLAANRMASEKLEEGITKFAADAETLKATLKEKMGL